jgi:hypothetical protein
MRALKKTTVAALLVAASASAWWVSAQSAGPAQQAAQRTPPPRDYPAQPAPLAVVHRYNRVAFAPVTTPALRLEITMQPKWSAGLQEWKVK